MNHYLQSDRVKNMSKRAQRKIKKVKGQLREEIRLINISYQEEDQPLQLHQLKLQEDRHKLPVVKLLLLQGISRRKQMRMMNRWRWGMTGRPLIYPLSVFQIEVNHIERWEIASWCDKKDFSKTKQIVYFMRRHWIVNNEKWSSDNMSRDFSISVIGPFLRRRRQWNFFVDCFCPRIWISVHFSWRSMWKTIWYLIVINPFSPKLAMNILSSCNLHSIPLLIFLIFPFSSILTLCPSLNWSTMKCLLIFILIFSAGKYISSVVHTSFHSGESLNKFLKHFEPLNYQTKDVNRVSRFV